jgi:hypothetical protein
VSTVSTLEGLRKSQAARLYSTIKDVIAREVGSPEKKMFIRSRASETFEPLVPVVMVTPTPDVVPDSMEEEPKSEPTVEIDLDLEETIFERPRETLSDHGGGEILFESKPTGTQEAADTQTVWTKELGGRPARTHWEEVIPKKRVVEQTLHEERLSTVRLDQVTLSDGTASVHAEVVEQEPEEQAQVVYLPPSAPGDDEKGEMRDD